MSCRSHRDSSLVCLRGSSIQGAQYAFTLVVGVCTLFRNQGLQINRYDPNCDSCNYDASRCSRI